MSMNIRYPNITGLSEKEQLSQIKSFLHQLVDQLNYAFPTLSESGSAQTVDVQGGEMSYYELRSLIIHELQEVDRLFQELSHRMESEYVSNEKLPQAINTALAQAKASGEFDGADGYTPVKYVDYFTEEEISSVATQAAGRLLFTLDEEGNLYYELEE